MYSPTPSLSTARTHFKTQFKQDHAYRLEKETGHNSHIDVQTTHENTHLNTDILLETSTKTPTIFNINITHSNTPKPPHKTQIAHTYAQMKELQDTPQTAYILSIGLTGGTLEKHQITFNENKWKTQYKPLLNKTY